MQNAMQFLARAMAILVLVSAASCTSATPDDATSAAAEETPNQASQAVPGLEGVDVQILNAVAPFDHLSEADSVIARARIANLVERPINQCLRDEEGFSLEVAPKIEAPEREEVIGGAPSTFPDVKSLAANGLNSGPAAQRPTSMGTIEGEAAPAETGPNESPTSQPTRRSDATLPDAEMRCFSENEDEYREYLAARDTFDSILSSWHTQVLEEIEQLAEIRQLRGRFTSCLEEAGIPSTHAVSETAYLGYVDELVLQNGSDDKDVRAEYGMLYASCGEELFAKREKLRAGVRRAEFLSQNQDAIEDLDRVVE